MQWNKVRVLVLCAGSRQILAILKGLHDLECEVTTLCMSKMDNGYVSRFPNHKILIEYCQGDELYQRILSEVKSGKYDVLLPLSDNTMNMITEHEVELAQYVRLPIPSRDVFLKAYDKQNTMEICMKNGIPCPITMLEEERVEEFAKRIGFPLIAKPRMANGSKGLKIVKDSEQLHRLIDSGDIKLEEYVIQEFVPQTGKQFNIHLFRDNTGELAANLVTEKARWYPVDGGASCLCLTAKEEKIAQNCEKLLKEIDWRSYCEIEMIVDPRDNVAKVMEINGRASASIKIMNLAGMNVAEQMLQLAYDLPVTKYVDYPTDIRMRCFVTDVLWLLKAPDRFSRKPFWFSPIRTKDVLFTMEDPLPFFAYIFGSIPKYSKEMKKRKRD